MNKFYQSAMLLLVLSAISCSKKATPPTTDALVIPPVEVPPTVNTTSLVYLAASGKLAYNKFANEGETNKDNIIPDFSTAGYKGGGVALPEIPVGMVWF